MSARASIVAKVFSPLAYVAVVLAAMLAALLTVRVLESSLGYDGPVMVYVAAELLVAGLVLYLGARALLELEDLRRPRIPDHLRCCALLYASFVPLGVALVALVDLGDPGGGGSLAVMLCVAAGSAIVVDALLLFIARKRSRLRTAGSNA